MVNLLTFKHAKRKVIMNKIHSDELYQMCVRHFNEPMLSFDGLARCVGYGETAVDCYIIVRKKSERYGEPGKLIWHTCVGGYTFLTALNNQGQVLANNGEQWNDLTRLDNELTRTGAPKESEFILKLDHDDHERPIDMEAYRTRMIEKYDADIVQARRELELLEKIRLSYVDRTSCDLRDLSAEEVEDMISELNASNA